MVASFLARAAVVDLRHGHIRVLGFRTLALKPTGPEKAMHAQGRVPRAHPAAP